MPTLLLTRRDVAGLLSLDDCIAAVDHAFRARGAGRAPPPGALGHPLPGGGFHVKAASLALDRPCFAAKINGNFAGNPARGLPRIQGVIVLCDAETGAPLALMDSTEITALRTAAATAVAARCLALPDAATATIVGCGVQGRVQLQALVRVRPLRRVFVHDSVPEISRRFAETLGPQLGIPIEPVAQPGPAARRSDLVVTCTPACEPILGPGDVRPGAFVAAVGADSEEKQELEPALLAAGAVVVDVLEQCAAFGELHHALDAGLLRREDVRGELGQVLAGTRPGRVSADEIVVFDSTGTALLDVAAAATAYRRATERGAGLALELGA